MIAALVVFGLVFAASGQTWRKTDPGGSYSATSAATRSGVRTGASSAKATWKRRRGDRAKKRADRRKRWERSGLLGWLAVKGERLAIGTARLGWDTTCTVVRGTVDGGKAARREWRTTWADHHPKPVESGPEGGPDRSTDHLAPDATPTAPAPVRLPVREPNGEQWWRSAPAPEPVPAGAGGLASAVKTAVVQAPPAHPSGIPGEQRCAWCELRPATTTRGKLAVCATCATEIDGQTARAVTNPDGSVSLAVPPRCSQCGQAATWSIRRGDVAICEDCAIRNVAEERARAELASPKSPGPGLDAGPDADGAPASTDNPFSHGGPPGMSTMTATPGTDTDSSSLSAVRRWCAAAISEITEGNTGALVGQASQLYEGFDGAIARIEGQVGQDATAVQELAAAAKEILTALIEQLNALDQTCAAAIGD